MLAFGREPWFRQWIQDQVLSLDFDKAKSEMERITGISLTQEEEVYYKYVLEKMRSKVQDVCDFNYNRELVEKNREEKLGKKILRLKYTISDKIIDIKNFTRKKVEDDGR